MLKRGGYRSSFTKTVNTLKQKLGEEEVDKGVLVDKFGKLQKLCRDIEELNELILAGIIAAGGKQEAVNNEMETWETYGDEYILISRLVNEKLSVEEEGGNARSRSGSGTVLADKTKQYKLPKIELRKFDGELLNWLPFWSQFEKIHEDPDLHDSDKFQYLVQCMKPGTRGQEFIESYPMSAKNYPKAIAALKERFGKSDLLIEVYVRELIKLIVSNVNPDNADKLPLSQLYDKLSAQLRALESLNICTEKNACWLYPMIESSLTGEVLKAWQRSSLFVEEFDDKTTSRLSNLMKFLKREVEGEERLKLAKCGFESSDHKIKNRDKPKWDFRSKFKSKASPNVATAAGFYVAKEQACIFCNRAHLSRECYEARMMSLSDKIDRIKSKNCCMRCLFPGHFARNCKNFVRCYSCGKAHVIALCPQMHLKPDTNKEGNAAVTVQATSNQKCSGEVALMTLVIRVRGNMKTKRVRALLDCGSQKSYILKETARELGLDPISKENVSHTLFGGRNTEPRLLNKYRISLLSTGPKVGQKVEGEVLEQEKLCGEIPRISKEVLFKKLKPCKIWISDIGVACPKIEVLIGSDLYGKILTGEVKQLDEGLTAINTKLGWTVCGQYGESPGKNDRDVSTFHTNFALNEFKVSDLWNLENIGISDAGGGVSKSEQDMIAREQFFATVHQTPDGRYSVGLPWLEHNLDLPSNRFVAERRLFSTTRKLKTLNKFYEYDDIFKEWLREGIIERVPKEQLGFSGYYMPHHPVFKPESSTTKIRPVFDASCKVGRRPSLNDCLLKGPNLIEDIPAILLRFREKCIGVTADIKGAFLQIELKPKDRDYVRFLWWASDESIEVFRHTRVVFGVTSSPFLLGAVISYHLSKAPAEEQAIAEKLKKSFYVDNCVASVDTVRELEYFVKKSRYIFEQAKMDLRKWTFGPCTEIPKTVWERLNISSEVVEDPVSVLGLQWNRTDDTLSIVFGDAPELQNLTKRNILSIVQGVYDPLGFLSPVLLPAKLMVQELWAEKSDWDSPLREELRERFQRWYRELQILTNFRVPRRVGYGNRNSWSMHTFCDSSRNAYATVIFLRCEVVGQVHVNFLISKSRVAPLKRVTIPRLELLACLLGARLSKYVAEALSLNNISRFFWSDSTTALSWIKRNDQWGTFVGNRVREICSLTAAEEWYFVPGQRNSADLPSRGCSPQHILKLLWWEGPDWLKESSECWPMVEIRPDEELVLLERKKMVTVLGVTPNTDSSEWYTRCSKFSKIVRVLAWIRRFIAVVRARRVVKDSCLTVVEVQEAKEALLLMVQREHFSPKGQSIHNLSIIEDEKGLIRIKTQIIERIDTFCFRYPILLPAKHHIVECLIFEYHQKNCHAGVQTLISLLREEYWIISARRTIRSVIRKCVKCRRFSAKAPVTPPIHLPEDRVRDASAFEIVGVDLCGPLFLRDKSKAWVVLFTCAIYRAVHLELVTSVSVDSFVQALRRFVSRRGRPSIIYCDNATNFTGTAAALKNVDWARLQETDLKPIQWNFIPPTAAWWGGWWERLIRSTKNLLVRVLGRASVTYEELLTILCEVEAVLNSRPLTYMSNDPRDLVALTPSNFLQDVQETGTPDLDCADSKRLLKRQKYCQELRENFKMRFRKEYLGQLVQKAGRSSGTTFKVGDVVLVAMDNQKRLNWPLAVIQELYKGRDGQVRVGKVKTHSGELIRPVQKLYPLEISSADSIVASGIKKRPGAKETSKPALKRPTTTVSPYVTRRGRTVKRPCRLGIDLPPGIQGGSVLRKAARDGAKRSLTS